MIPCPDGTTIIPRPTDGPSTDDNTSLTTSTQASTTETPDNTCPGTDFEAACDSLNDSTQEDDKFKCLHTARHNKVRELHQNTPSLSMVEELNPGAQAWADDLASRDAFEHADSGDRPNQGENLYLAWTSRTLTGDDLSRWVIAKSTDAVQSWYDEIEDYNWATPNGPHSGVVGHFTQVVWTSSVELGIGYKTYRVYLQNVAIKAENS